MIKHTESESYYNDLENKSTSELLYAMNKEDQTVALAVHKAIPSILPLVDLIVDRFFLGGRLFYIGSGTSGRLGILDASECPPTFGVPHNMVVGLIAGGDSAIRKAVENAEDDTNQGWRDLLKENIQKDDVLIGIASSGTTPYVIGALQEAQRNGITTACITCNEKTPAAKLSDYPIEVVVGSEFITGSTRLKSGTAQKMILNMISTVSMIKIGRVKGNKMVDMKLSNKKLVERGVQMLVEKLSINEHKARKKLLKYGSVREALKH